MKNLTEFKQDTENNKLYVTRKFNAPLPLVWNAWTEADKLDQWWAPKPYKAETKTMNFREGGYWLYNMQGPEGDIHWSRADYLKISAGQYFTAKDCFCNEDGVPNTELPRMHWNNEFKQNNGQTQVSIEITFENKEDIQKIVEMGFKEGFSAGLENLDELLDSWAKK